MRKLTTVSLFSGLLLFFTASAMAQSPVSVTVAHLVLPPNVVRANAVMGLTRQANWVDAPAKWEWEKVHDSAGFVKSIIVYVTLDPDNTTQAYGKTICCWTYAETSLVATDVSGVQYTYPLFVTAQ
jgi:hypothetical protein